LTKTNNIFPKNSNQPCNSPFIHISSENIDNINSENSNIKRVINLKDNEFEIPETFKDIQFRKTYFSNADLEIVIFLYMMEEKGIAQ